MSGVSSSSTGTTELVIRLRDHVGDDHHKGCLGRNYYCDCGHDDITEGLLGMAADEIERLSGAAQALPDRDAIARIIDPDCAAALISERKWCEQYGKNFEVFARGYIDRWERALSKADAILAAAPQPASNAVLSPDYPRAVVAEAMRDAWNTICSDTDCHPDDIQRRGKKLFFEPGHWVDLIALFLDRGPLVSSTHLGCGTPGCTDPDCTYGKGPNTDPLLHTPRGSHE